MDNSLNILLEMALANASLFLLRVKELFPDRIGK